MKRPVPPTLAGAAAPLMALVFAIVASSIVLLLAGSNPLQAYSDMMNHASKLETMIDILNRATPLFISGIAAAIGFRMNLFNIGVEGQYLLAALVAAQVGGVIEPARATPCRRDPARGDVGRRHVFRRCRCAEGDARDQ